MSIDLHTSKWKAPRAWVGPAMVVTTLLAGCGHSSDSSKTVGELGNGEFVYECVVPNDAACAQSIEPIFPTCIALGGRFGMSYVLHDSSAVDSYYGDVPFFYVQSASPTYFSGNGSFTAERVGRAALLARADDQIVDIIHLDIISPTSLEVYDEIGVPVSTPLQIAQGHRIPLRVVASSECSPIGGGANVTAISSDPRVATATNGETTLLFAHDVGEATITFSMGNATAEIAVEVTPAPVDGTDDTMGGTSDAGTSDAGTGSSGDATGGTTGTGTTTDATTGTTGTGTGG